MRKKSNTQTAYEGFELRAFEKSNKALKLLTLILFFCSGAFVAPALSKEQKSDKEPICDSVAECLPLAKHGNMEAQYELGELYYRGNSGTIYLKGAFEWFYKSAEQGYAEAQHKIGFFYDAGYVRHLTNYGDSFDANEDKQRYIEVYKWYLKASEQGYQWSQHNLGDMYEHGTGVKKNTEIAKYWYLKAANQGNASSQFSLGLMSEQGWWFSRNYKAAREWYLKAAKQNHKKALNNLGWQYERGRGVPQDYRKALEWYLKAAELGHHTSIINIGRFFEKGLGVEQSYSMAEKWYFESARRGGRYAQFRLGMINMLGLSGSKNLESAYLWFYLSAKRGHIGAKVIVLLFSIMFGSSDEYKDLQNYAEKYHTEVKAFQMEFKAFQETVGPTFLQSR